MRGVSYLTVQDMLWISQLVTGKVLPFDYARLEEGTYFQYAYGRSADVPAQAARFLEGFAQKAPFPEGNEAAAFVGFATFLRLNGYDLDASDAQAAALPLKDLAVRSVESSLDGHGEAKLKDVVLGVIADFPKTIAALSGKVAAAA